MLHIICLTKSYNIDDFEAWINWHTEETTQIHVLDNESFIDVKPICEKYHTGYTQIKGFADQWGLFGRILNLKTEIQFQEDDLVTFIDDDEYLWYDKEVYPSLECALRAQFKQLSCLLIPEILMSTHHLEASRSKILPEFCYYRRADIASQGKSVIIWAPWKKYSFNHGETEIGHVPWISKMRFSDVVGSGVSKTTYGLCDYDAPVRLYHYHIKTKADWKLKISRGSAAKQAESGQNGNYDPDITKNKKFGGYDVPDFTMLKSFGKN